MTRTGKISKLHFGNTIFESVDFIINLHLMYHKLEAKDTKLNIKVDIKSLKVHFLFPNWGSEFNINVKMLFTAVL